MKTSKFIFKTILVATLGLFLFTSCSSDDDNGSVADNNDVENLLIGKWYFDFDESDPEISECEQSSYLQFYENDTAYGMLFTLANGDCIPLMSTDYNYELLDENTIQFVLLDDQGEEEDDFFNAEILSISENEMVLKDFAFFTEEPMTFIKALE